MDKFLNELSFYGFQFRRNVENQRVLRGSTLVLVLGMIFSNCTFMVVWYFFSQAIGTINGWGAAQTFGIQAIAIFTFGIGFMMFGSLGALYPHIERGSFDAFLTKPKNLYVRIGNNEMMPAVLGDLVHGFICMVMYCVWAKPNIGLLLLMLPPAVLIQIAFTMAADCISFWLPQAPGLAKAVRELIIGPSIQPLSLFNGWMRIVCLIVVPALVVSGLPVEVVTYHKYELIVLSYIISIIWLFLSIWILKISVRRYESGNVIG